MKQKIHDYETVDNIIKNCTIEIIPELQEIFDVIKEGIELKEEIDKLAKKQLSKKIKK